MGRLKSLCLALLAFATPAIGLQVWHPPEPGRYPLILLSHGHKGSPQTLSWLGKALSSKGFIVAAPHHDDKGGNELRRPADVSAAIDALLSSDLDIDERRIGMAGFSLGATTGLCLGGGIPEFRDSRIRAFFLMAPALPDLFSEQNLAQLDLPIQLVVAESDQVTPNAAAFAERIPTATLEVVPGDADHYVFLTPRSNPAEHLRHFYTDPPNVDRCEIQERTSAQALAFFHDTLR